MKRLPLLAPLLALLLGACATGSTPAPFTPGPVNPLASIAVRVGAADACDQATRTGGGPALLAKVSAAEALVTSGDVLAVVEQALLAGADARRAFYLDLIIQGVQQAGSLPKTVTLAPGSPAAQLVTAALAGCRAGVGLNSTRAKLEALEAPAPSLSGYLAKAGYGDSIAKGSGWFDTSLPLDQRLVHGKIDTGAPSGTYERVGLDPAKVKGPMVGPEGASCDVVQWWIDHVGPSFGVPVNFQCGAADLFDALYTDGHRGNNSWNDIYLSAYIAGHPIVTPPAGPPAINPVCLSGGCFPVECPENCTTVPPKPPDPPVIPGCPAVPVHPALVIPADVQRWLKDLASGKRVNWLHQADVAKFFAAHPGLRVP